MVIGTARGTFLPCLVILGCLNPDTRRHQHKGATHDPMLGWSPGVPVEPPSPSQFCKQTTYTIFSIQMTKIDENPLFDTL